MKHHLPQGARLQQHLLARGALQRRALPCLAGPQHLQLGRVVLGEHLALLDVAQAVHGEDGLRLPLQLDHPCDHLGVGAAGVGGEPGGGTVHYSVNWHICQIML